MLWRCESTARVQGTNSCLGTESWISTGNPRRLVTKSKIFLRFLDGVVRIDTGVREKDAISIFYDPMIAKLIVWGKTRELAIRQMSSALTEYRIMGLPNNINFLKRVLGHPEYVSGNYDTGFISKNQVGVGCLVRIDIIAGEEG